MPFLNPLLHVRRHRSAAFLPRYDEPYAMHVNGHIAGNYAFDPEDGFSLKVLGYEDDAPILEWLAIKGRTYSVVGSDDLENWDPVRSRPTAEETPFTDTYFAGDVHTVRVHVSSEDTSTSFKFFKLIVQ